MYLQGLLVVWCSLCSQARETILYFQCLVYLGPPVRGYSFIPSGTNAPKS
jgi:hypothetical protein